MGAGDEFPFAPTGSRSKLRKRGVIVLRILVKLINAARRAYAVESQFKSAHLRKYGGARRSEACLPPDATQLRSRQLGDPAPLVAAFAVEDMSLMIIKL
jgi:hypothetical protein